MMRNSMSSYVYTTLYFFFFQAEDGIRDYKVTGVQTCALPISFHRPAHERLVADERRVESLRRQQAHHQAHGGAGIAQVEGRARRCEAACSDSAHQHLRLPRPLDVHPEFLQRPRRGEAILAGEEATDVRVALGERTEHERAVRDRLVARHRERALDAAAGADAITGAAGLAHSTARG